MGLIVNQTIIIVSLKTFVQKLSRYRVRMMMTLKNED
jgi:hypothetical protein